MRTNLIATAVIAVVTTAASAGSFDSPYALSAIHQDFLEQLEATASEPGEVGVAARSAVGVLKPHIELEERVVLPFLGLADVVTDGASVNPEIQDKFDRLTAELPRILDADANLFGALVELYSAADSEGRADIVQLAERLVWHETNDFQVFYPAAVLVGQTIRGSIAEADSWTALWP